MQNTFDTLQKLQDVLSEKYAIEKSLRELPKKLMVKTEILSRISKGKEEKVLIKETLDKKLGQLRHSLAENSSKKEALEKKMATIKTQREFEVLEKEINDTGLAEEQCRKETVALSNEINEIEKNLALDVLLITEQQAELDADKNKIEKESENERKQLEALGKKEKALIPDLNIDLVSKFEAIIRNKEGQGIVAVKGGICQGCHMILPGQFVNNVRSGEEILFCPHCSRVLFFEEGGKDFSNVFFDHDDGALLDLIDEDDEEEIEEERPLIDSDIAGDYEDN